MRTRTTFHSMDREIFAVIRPPGGLEQVLVWVAQLRVFPCALVYRVPEQCWF